MWRIFSALINAVIPEHEDVVNARALSPEDIVELMRPRAGPYPWITALLPYRDPRVRALIRALKYHGETMALERVGAALGAYLADTIAEKKLLAGWSDPLIVPIPASPKRLREREYNQAERIARAALRHLGTSATLEARALGRAERRSQVAVARAKRKENIRGAFFVRDPNAVRGRFVILLDDVSESGATLADAGRALRVGGAKEVIGIVLAH